MEEAGSFETYNSKLLFYPETRRKLHFYPEDGGTRFLRNVGTYQTTQRHIPIHTKRAVTYVTL
jgi:hypothetical protein